MRAMMLALATLATSSAAWGEPFTVGCTLPFDGIKEEQDIDATCPAEGTGTTDAHRAQNRAKNNFCASGTPVLVTHLTMTRLQEAVEDADPDIPFGARDTLPPDRSRLKDLRTTTEGDLVGEGTRVQLVGFVLEAHRGGEEAVNCDKGRKENTDIHIAIGKQRATSWEAGRQDDVLCKSVTAEISPHFRPSAWGEDIREFQGRALWPAHPVHGAAFLRCEPCAV